MGSPADSADPAAFARVQELFLAASAATGRQREEILARAGEDSGAAVVEQVRRLLASHSKAEGWLEPPPPAAAWRDAALAHAVSPPVPELRGQPSRLGSYRIEREVGRGGMGVVYEAFDTALSRRVALKVLTLHHHLDPRFLERFRREAKAVAGLDHEHIIPVYGAGEEDGQHYYAMHFIDGVPLSRVIADLRHARARHDIKPRDSTESSAVRTPAGRLGHFLASARHIEHAADAIAHAHAHGVLHRDLKPSNLLLDPRGKVWVGDFGLARVEGSDDLTRDGEMIGTLRYMAPESLHRAADARGDVYALGLILYELLTLTPAFDAPDRARLMAKIAHSSVSRPRRIDASIPSDLETIVLKAIATEPVDRYSTAKALADDLRAFRTARPIAARAPSFTHLVRLAIRRHRAVSATVAVALVVIAGGTLLYLLHLGRALDAARAAEREATRQQSLTETARQEAEFQGYVAAVAAAQAALNEGDLVTARKHLGSAPTSLRGWEWRHVAAHLDLGERTMAYERPPLSDHNYDLTVDQRIHPDGRRLVGVTHLGIRIWDLETGASIASSPPLRQMMVPKFVWGPDAETLLVGTVARHRLDVWSLEPLERKWTVTLPGEPVAIGADPAGRTCIAGMQSGEVVSVDASTARHRTLARLGAPVRAISVAPDGRTVAVVAAGRLHQVRCDTGASREVCLLPGLPTRALAYDPTGRLVAAGLVGQMCVVDMATGSMAAVIPLSGGSAYEVIFHPDGRRIAIAQGAAGALVWDLATREAVNVIAAHDHRTTSLAFHPDGRRLATGGRDLAIKVFDLDRLGPTEIRRGHFRDVDHLAVSPDGRWLATGGERDGLSRVWDARTLEPVVTLQDPDWSSLRFTPEGELLALPKRRRDGAWILRVLDPVTMREARAIATPFRVTKLVFDASGSALYVGGGTSRLARLRWPSGEALWSKRLPAERFHVSRDGRMLAGSRGGDVTLIDTSNGVEVRRLAAPVHADTLGSFVFVADDACLATVGLDRTLALWDVATGELRSRLSGHAHGIQSVDLTPDGTRLVTAARDGVIKLWDPIRAVEVFSTRVTAAWTRVRFDAQGSRIWFWNSDGDFGFVAGDGTAQDAELGGIRHGRQIAADRIAAGIEAQHADSLAAALAALAAREDIGPDERTGVERRLRALPDSHRALLVRLAANATVSKSDADLLRGLVANLTSLVRAWPSATNRVRLGIVRLRSMEPALAVAVLRAGDFDTLDPASAQIRLAILALALARTGDAPFARETFATLQADVAARGIRLPPSLLAETEAGFAGVPR